MTIQPAKAAALGNHLYRSVADTPPAQVWLGLLDVTLTELTGSGYARQRLDDSLPAFSTITGLTTSTAAVQFPEATAAWSAAHHVGFFAASTGGAAYTIQKLASPVTVATGRYARIPAGSLIIGMGAVPDGVWEGGVRTGDVPA